MASFWPFQDSDDESTSGAARPEQPKPRPPSPARAGESPVVPAIFGLMAIAALVFAGFLAHAAYSERTRANQFLAAPRCTGNATPASDCVGWETRTVTRAESSKSGLNIDLDGGVLHLWYVSAPGWVDGLAAGDSVPVMVWEGSAQALRDPQGQVFYSEDSALHQGDSDIGIAVCMSGFALFGMGGLFVSAPWFRRPGSRSVPLAIVLTDAGVSGVVGGAVIQGANSVDTGAMVGVIVFCAIGVVVVVLILLRRTTQLAAHG